MGAADRMMKIDKSLTINYPIEKVKESIKSLSKASVTKYRINSENDNFNTYRLAISNGLNFLLLDITMNPVGEEKTELSLLITPATGAIASISVLSGKLDEYLNHLSEELEGKAPFLNLDGTKKNTGCMVLIGVLLLSTAFMSFILL